MRGTAWALDLPREDPARGDRTKLATRDDGGDANRVEPTMSELAGEGAAVILAALDPVSAERAAVKWGEERTASRCRHRSPYRRQDGASGRPARLGVRHRRGAATPRSAALAEELVSRAVVKIVPIVPPLGQREGGRGAREGDRRAPAPRRLRHRRGAIGRSALPRPRLEAGARSHLAGRRAERVRARPRARPRRGPSRGPWRSRSTPPARAPAPPAVKALWCASAPSRLPPAPDAITDPDIRAWYAREGAPPNWWAALGHDAAALARRAVSALPLDPTTDPAEVARSAAPRRKGRPRQRRPTSGRATLGASPPARVAPRDAKVVELPALTATTPPSNGRAPSRSS